MFWLSMNNILTNNSCWWRFSACRFLWGYEGCRPAAPYSGISRADRHRVEVRVTVQCLCWLSPAKVACRAQVEPCQELWWVLRKRPEAAGLPDLCVTGRHSLDGVWIWLNVFSLPCLESYNTIFKGKWFCKWPNMQSRHCCTKEFKLDLHK